MIQKDLMKILEDFDPNTRVIILGKGSSKLYPGVYRVSYLPIISHDIDYIEDVYNLLDDEHLLRIWLK